MVGEHLGVPIRNSSILLNGSTGVRGRDNRPAESISSNLSSKRPNRPSTCVGGGGEGDGSAMGMGL